MSQNESGLEERRKRYLAASSLVLALFGWKWFPNQAVLLAALGLACFLAWFLSGILRAEIELEETARRVIVRFEHWKEAEEDGRPHFIAAAREYAGAVGRADAAQPHLDIISELEDNGSPWDRVGIGVTLLRKWIRRRFLYRIF